MTTSEGRISLQIITADKSVHLLASRILEENEDIAVEEKATAIVHAGLFGREQPADVFFVSLPDPGIELNAVERIKSLFDRPVIVYSASLSSPNYENMLREAGAFDVMEKATARLHGNYLKFLGTKIGTQVQSAHTHWKKEQTRREIIVPDFQKTKLPLSGKVAHRMVAVALEGEEEAALGGLLNKCKSATGTAFVVAHRGTNARATREWIHAVNRESEYHVAPAQSNQRLNENVVLVAPAGQMLRVEGNVVVLETMEPGDAEDVFDALFESVGVEYEGRAVGVAIGGPLQNGQKGLAKLREAGGLSVVEIEPDGEFKTEGNDRYLPRPMLCLAVWAHLGKLQPPR